MLNYQMLLDKRAGQTWVFPIKSNTELCLIMTSLSDFLFGLVGNGLTDLWLFCIFGSILLLGLEQCLTLTSYYNV